ncbi:MAG: MarR family transcriptional regulator [Candidatus Firestonebacteria bacterium]
MKINNIISLISQVREKANKFLVKEMHGKNIKGLVTSHGDIIFSLFEESKLTMKDLKGKTGKDKSTVTALVDKLEKLGFVKKNKSLDDARITYITLTEKGLTLKPKLIEISEKLFNSAYKGIADKEVELVNNVLIKIKKNL